MVIKMKKILIITGDKCDDSEFFYPYYRLIEEGFAVDVATIDKKDAEAKHYLKIKSDCSVCDVNTDDYCALLLPGGGAPENLRINDDVLNIVKNFNDSKKPIAAICHGPQILISAGVLKGKKATCYKGIKDDILNSGALYEDSDAVVCENIVTSRCPDDLPAFMKNFINIIK